MNYINLGKRIREARNQKRLTQESLGEAAEITSSYIGQIERGERKVTLGKIVRISEVLGVSLDTLVCGDIENLDKNFSEIVTREIKNCGSKEKAIIIDIIKTINHYSCNDNEGEF